MYTTRPGAFEYRRPTSVADAIAALAEVEDARPLAGGHSLLPMMKLRFADPPALVDLGRIPGLNGIDRNGDTIRIGALATHSMVASSAVVRSACPVLAETAGLIGDPQVRNRGTIGGSLAHADPGADYPTLMKALGATITIAGADGERDVAADDFFVGVFATVLQPAELVTRVAVTATQGAAYVKHVHPASGYAVVGVAAVVAVDGGNCAEARIAVGGAVASPVRATAAEALIVGSDGSADAVAAAAALVPQALGEAIGDLYASAEYRTHLAAVLAARALTAALDRA
jgi:carbon-monoxide dehydrogenase medium subunit